MSAPVAWAAAEASTTDRHGLRIRAYRVLTSAAMLEGFPVPHQPNRSYGVARWRAAAAIGETGRVWTLPDSALTTVTPRPAGAGL